MKDRARAASAAANLLPLLHIILWQMTEGERLAPPPRPPPHLGISVVGGRELHSKNYLTDRPTDPLRPIRNWERIGRSHVGRTWLHKCLRWTKGLTFSREKKRRHMASELTSKILTSLHHLHCSARRRRGGRLICRRRAVVI